MILHVGILVDGLEVSAWESAMLKKVVESGAARFSVVLVDRGAGISRANPLLKLYGMLDGKLFKYKPDAFQTSDVRSILQDVPVISLDGNNGAEEGLELSEGDIGRIKDHNLDVILRLGTRDLRGSLLNIPSYGVWAYVHGDTAQRKGVPQGFWELAENRPVMESSLRILSGDAGKDKILVSSFSRTHKLSLNKSRNITFWKSVSFATRKLEELSRNGGGKFLEKVSRENLHPRFVVGRTHDNPTVLYTMFFLLRQAWRVLMVWSGRRLSVDQWCLAFFFSKGLATMFWDFQRFTPPRDRFWADPHVIQWGGEYYIFLEEYVYSKQRGHISVSKMGEQGEPTKPIMILERDYHLSYPFVFSWNGICYMMPETSRNRTIELYECHSFPDQWSLKLVLMDHVRAVDSTLLYLRGKWWLFTNIAENEGAETTDELFLFHSDNFLTQQWKPHPLNPIVSDVRRARPAGRIFEYAGDLYRPSQDCSEEYGGGINFQKIVTLTEDAYHEEQVSSSKPEWDKKIIGLHTYSREGEMTVIDLCVRRPRR